MHLESVQLSPEMRTNSETRKRRRATRHQHQSLVHQLFAAATAVVAIAPVLMTGSSALQLSMVASHYRRTTVRPGASKVRSRTFSSPPAHSGVGGVTSSLVSQLAVAALKLRLADQSAVKCDVTADASDLLMRGRVGPVSVRGRGWRSQLGLSCRAIDATVNRCDLDMGVMMSRRKLVLTTPAKGDALIAMNSKDFGNFITHPLMKPPVLRSNECSQAIKFAKEGVTIDVNNGSVTFYGTYMEERWRCTLRRGEDRGQGRAMIVVEPTSVEKKAEFASAAMELTEAISDFFNRMVFELGGTFLSFRDMMITSKGESPNIMLAISITVKKFPSAGLAF